MPIDRSLPLDESLRAFRTFTFELTKWERKFRSYPALLSKFSFIRSTKSLTRGVGLHTARLTTAFSWIFQHPQSPLVPPGSNTPIVDTSNATLNNSPNPTGTSHSAGSV